MTSSLVLGSVSSAAAQSRGNNEDDRYDEDGNGFPDEGEEVTGGYKAVVAYDATGAMYQRNPSGLGNEYGTPIEDLDQDTLTTCNYKVRYRGTFGNDANMDTGWIRNNIVCKGHEPDNRNVLWVHESDPRYTGDRPEAFGGDWEVHVDSRRGRGNVITEDVRPHSH